MAVVKLADIYDAVPFNNAVSEAATELNTFYQAGILTITPAFNALANESGFIGELPYWQALATDEPNYSSDDDTSDAVPKKIGHSKMVYRKAMMNQVWSTMDLARELALTDPLTEISNGVAQYWATQINKRVIQSSLGVLADNEANDSGDMVYDIATDDVLPILAAEKISATAVLAAKQTMGDAAGVLSGMAMHSVVYTELQSQNLITFIPNARGEVNIPTYLGYRIVVDDSLPAVAGINRITYTTILFASGAFAWGQGTPSIPSELSRSATSGDGGGQDRLHSRRTDIIHPRGFSFLSASIAGNSAALSELATATEWNRVYDRKNCGLAFLKTNG